MLKYVIALFCLALAGCSTSDDEVVEMKQPIDILPTVTEFKLGKVSYHDSDSGERLEFDITDDDWITIRAALLPATRVSNPAKWEGLGGLEIVKKNGEPFAISLYYLPDGEPGAFAAGKTYKKRVYYRGGTTAALEKALKAAYEKSKMKKD